MAGLPEDERVRVRDAERARARLAELDGACQVAFFNRRPCHMPGLNLLWKQCLP